MIKCSLWGWDAGFDLVTEMKSSTRYEIEVKFFLHIHIL